MIDRVMRFLNNPEIRFNYLSIMGFYNYMSDEAYIKKFYRIHTGKDLNLDSPKLFNEKIQWLKIHDKNPDYTLLVDKYSVKKYVADMIGKKYIIPTLAVWNDVNEVDFDSLPNQFVLKTTHDSGGVYICQDKTELNPEEVRRYLEKWMKRDYYRTGREYPYKNVVRRIIAEKFMVDESGKELKDYKVFCFNGEPRMIQVDFDRFVDHKRNLYTTKWEYIPASIKFPTNPQVQIRKPEHLDEMLLLARKLSNGIPFLRTDFYVVKDNIYFGELTFYHGSGVEKFTPSDFEEKVGEWLELPTDKSFDTYKSFERKE